MQLGYGALATIENRECSSNIRDAVGALFFEVDYNANNRWSHRSDIYAEDDAILKVEREPFLRGDECIVFTFVRGYAHMALDSVEISNDETSSGKRIRLR